MVSYDAEWLEIFLTSYARYLESTCTKALYEQVSGLGVADLWCLLNISDLTGVLMLSCARLACCICLLCPNTRSNPVWASHGQPWLTAHPPVNSLKLFPAANALSGNNSWSSGGFRLNLSLNHIP